MPITFTENIFNSRYKDDYADSDGFHRILFNPRRALQARELTQLQTIIQKEVERFGRNLFKDGAAVNSGGLVINDNYEFVKITDANFPANIVGETFTGQTSNVQIRVLETVASSGSDPNTLYVRYTNSSSGTSGTTPIRLTPGEQIDADNLSVNMTVQTVNTAANPAIGAGVRVSTGSGDFFVQGIFVNAPAQSIIISKYSRDKSIVIGFKVVQDIVTVDDDVSLYDNQGSVPNQTAPGADRYRIRLILTTKDDTTATDTFVPIGKIENSKIIDVAIGQNQYGKINDIIAQRTKEESGNYIIRPFTVSYDSASAANLKLTISEGTAYVNGYRVNNPTPTFVDVPRSTSTTTFNNEPISSEYGNFVIATEIKGAADITQFSTQTIATDASNLSGTAIGSCRIRSVEALSDGTFKIYLFDIQMTGNNKFRTARVIGTSATNVSTLKLGLVNNTLVAELFEADKEGLFFSLPRTRPSGIADISFVAQRKFSGTTDGSGNLGISVTAPGETFVNTSDWLVYRNDTGAKITPSSITGNATTSSTIATGVNSTAVSVLVYVQKAQAAPKTKALANHTKTGALAADSDGLGNGITALTLDATDIVGITSIKADSAGGTDVSHMFDLDNGQRDGYYGQGRVILKSNFTSPGTVVATVQHFTHTTTGDFFSANSYSTIPYKTIPSFTSKTGKTFNLRDVLDFRSVKDVSGAFTGSGARVIELPKNTDVITADNSYYMPRNDKIVISETGDLKVIQGASAIVPKFPDTPANTMELYRVKMGANTLDATDVAYDQVSKQGYTMKDIGKIEKRVEKLEELHSLSLLEIDTNKLSIVDSTGNERIKAGFVVDNFIDHFHSDISNTEYRASVDPKDHTLHPGFFENNIGLVFDSTDTDTSGVIRKGDNIYVSFTDSSYISQDQASITLDVNSFDTFQFNGNITLSPSSDEWKEEGVGTKAISGGTKLSNDQNELWNSWEWNWIGTDANGLDVTEDGASEIDTRSFSERTGAFLTRGLENVEKTIVNRVVSSETIRKSVDERIVDVAIVPFMRSRLIKFDAIGLRPNTRVFPYFDNVDVSAFCREEPFTFHAQDSDGSEFGNTQEYATAHPSGSTNLVTDGEGRVSGSFFIPNTPSISFRSGAREFKLLDITTSDETNASTKAAALFNSSGAIEKNRTGIVTTRHIAVSGTDKNVLSDKVIGSTDTRGRIDPLAQSFFVNNETGVFVSSIELYFKSKDADLPVWIQIVPVVNGSPSREVIVPGSTKYLSSTAVNISDDAATSTTFEFDEPIFLDSFTEYVIVVQSDSKTYKLWAAQTGDLNLGSTVQRISKQTEVGALFLPQNSYKWEPVYNKDLKFKINRCKFNTGGSNTAILNNADVPLKLLGNNPISTSLDSNTITVLHPNHGHEVGDVVTIAGGGTIGGLATDGDKTITQIDGTGYTYAGSGTANSTTSGGGLDVTATQNLEYDLINPYIETLTPQNTAVSAQIKQTTAKSYAGSETAYVKDTSYSDIVIKQSNYLEAPRKVTHRVKGAKSAQVKLSLSTSNDFVSPIVDLQRSSLILIGNRIDKQTQYAAGAGFNTPIDFVDETDKNSGSHLSKHITKPISLLTDAVGLKVLLSANRPSVADFDLYYKTISEDQILSTIKWNLATKEALVPSDENRSVFREYRYLIGGDGGTLVPFTTFQLKIVFKSTNSSKVPIIKDLRAIALGV